MGPPEMGRGTGSQPLHADIGSASIVRSGAGRDKGKLFVVLAAEGEYLLLADGRSRKLESPKRKKRRHVSFVSSQEGTRLFGKLRGGGKVTNKELRRTLAACRDALEEEQPAGENGNRRDSLWQNPI